MSNDIRLKRTNDIHIPSQTRIDPTLKPMKCLDAIEGNVQSILTHIFDVYVEDRLDDTEYIRNVKAVIAATDDFIRKNPDITDSPHILEKVLYTFSKNLWIEHLRETSDKDLSSDSEDVVSRDEEYHEYYYDHIYEHGTYPR